MTDCPRTWTADLFPNLRGTLRPLSRVGNRADEVTDPRFGLPRKAGHGGNSRLPARWKASHLAHSTSVGSWPQGRTSCSERRSRLGRSRDSGRPRRPSCYLIQLVEGRSCPSETRGSRPIVSARASSGVRQALRRRRNHPLFGVPLSWTLPRPGEAASPIDIFQDRLSNSERSACRRASATSSCSNAVSSRRNPNRWLAASASRFQSRRRARPMRRSRRSRSGGGS